MDQDLQKRIEEAKAAGYSDEEIAKALGTAPPPAQATMPNGINVPILSAEEKAQFNKSEQQASSRNTGEQVATGATAAALGAAAVGVPAAAIYAGKKIFSPAVRAGSDLAQRGVGAMESANAINKTGVENLQKRFDVNQANKMAANAPKGPVVPQAMPGVSTAGPVAPANMPAANQPQMRAPQPSIASRVQAAAAQRISNLPAMGEIMGGAMRTAGRILGPAGLALESRDLGPKTPQTGRMRGMEINPLTGAPWTPEQIAQYEANPAQYDAQMAPPQFRR